VEEESRGARKKHAHAHSPAASVPGSAPRKRRLEPLDAQQEALHSRHRHASPCCLFNSAGAHARDDSADPISARPRDHAGVVEFVQVPHLDIHFRWHRRCIGMASTFHSNDIEEPL
jgi:hypothetical protein